jgi:hypothetical protein
LSGTGRVYYDHDGVQITTSWLVVPDRRYPVHELRSLRTTRGPYHPYVTATVVAAAAFLFMVAGSLPFFYDDPAGWIGAGTVATIPIGMALAALRLRPRAYELWADYRGETVPVFWTYDETTFGQVTRALVRATEANRPGIVRATAA